MYCRHYFPYCTCTGTSTVRTYKYSIGRLKVDYRYSRTVPTVVSVYCIPYMVMVFHIQLQALKAFNCANSLPILIRTNTSTVVVFSTVLNLPVLLSSVQYVQYKYFIY